MKPKSKERIDTQIHRRRAAPASGAMETEWDISEGQPPVQLRITSSPSLSQDSTMAVGGKEDREGRKRSETEQK